MRTHHSSNATREIPKLCDRHTHTHTVFKTTAEPRTKMNLFSHLQTDLYIAGTQWSVPHCITGKISECLWVSSVPPAPPLGQMPTQAAAKLVWSFFRSRSPSLHPSVKSSVRTELKYHACFSRGRATNTTECIRDRFIRGDLEGCHRSIQPIDVKSCLV